MAQALKMPLVGYLGPDGFTSGRGYYTSLWSSTAFDATNTYYRKFLWNYSTVYRGNVSKSYGFIVRCLKD